MKKLITSFFVTALLLVIGCQDVPPTEPTGAIQKLNNPITKEVLSICCCVNDPLSGSCQVIGEVSYVHEIVDIQTGPNDLILVRVQLGMDTELCDRLGRFHLEWGIVGNSEDLIYVSEEGIYILQKAYPICNRNDCVLVVQYLVTTEGIGIPNMWVELIDKS